MKAVGYVILWVALVLTVRFQVNEVMPWLVGVLDSLPAVWVAMLSWLPLGVVTVALAIAKPTERGYFPKWLAGLAAIPGLCFAVQLPLALPGRRAYDAYDAAAATDTGAAFQAGFLWAVGLVMLWALIFRLLRLGRTQKTMRLFAFGTMVASLIGLIVSVVTR